MPLNKYFGGHGEEVMDKMQGKYGEEGGKRVFYATDNKMKKKKRGMRGKKKGGFPFSAKDQAKALE